MKAFIKRSFIIAIFLVTVSNSFCTPLNGTYTIGSGGNYVTINSALSDAATQGIDGPVIFDIMTGTYNEEVFIPGFPGSSDIYTVTLKSKSGNSADVVINGNTYVLAVFSSNIIISDLTIGSSSSNWIEIGGENIRFTKNNLNNSTIYNLNYLAPRDIYISGNVNAGRIDFQGIDPGAYIFNIQITNNSISGSIFLAYCFNVLIENNSIGNGIITFTSDISVVKNKIAGHTDAGGNYYNNFITGSIRSSGNFINNTVVGGTDSTPPLVCYSYNFLNNIIINPSGGPAISTFVYTAVSDYNDFYNGANNNLINYEGTAYNNVSDFYNATGLDGHSNSQPITFVSPNDLHLSGSSIGDEQLAGIPNASVTDDIDGQSRSLFFPYKGADEAPDFPLPVELSSFTSSVSNNDVRLNWTTASEMNNSGFDLERSDVKGQTSDEWNRISFINGHGTTATPNNYVFTDNGLDAGKYKYRLKQIDFNGNYEYFNLANDVIVEVPDKYSLSQNYPNPFNPTTNLEFGISNLEFVSLKVYNVLGKEVAMLVNDELTPGIYKVKFDGSNISSGVYFYKLTAGNFSAVKKMFLMK